MKNKDKLLLCILYTVLVVVAILIGYLLIDVQIRVGMKNDSLTMVLYEVERFAFSS